MRPEARKYLLDILGAAADIGRYMGGADLRAYLANDMLRAAVERKFEIIGEAANAIGKIDATLADRIQECSAIIAFRNKLIHGYSVVDHERVYLATQLPLERLRRSVEAILAEAGAR
jgi:uncharacterized protein with HEPN domain